MVLVSYDERGRITDFGSVEIQAVYISGNVRAPFEHYMLDPIKHSQMKWNGVPNFPRPDYLSSSRKRLAPQLLFKGGIFHAWQKKQAVVLHRGFFNTLPSLTRVDPAEAELAWLIYDLQHDPLQNQYRLTKTETVFTSFEPTLHRLTTAEPGSMDAFIQHLQSKLDEKLDGSPPDAPVFTDILLT